MNFSRIREMYAALTGTTKAEIRLDVYENSVYAWVGDLQDGGFGKTAEEAVLALEDRLRGVLSTALDTNSRLASGLMDRNEAIRQVLGEAV